ncbi:hypothetical protein [Streptomyces sp. NPDC059459]|uniref:hypothetical protein n=1 Tax=unclassified Streptomyces TaxID=2593676 RepID=UPI0036BBE3B7
MAEERESAHKRAGRLYATLRMLKHLGGAEGARPCEEDRFGGKDSPLMRVRRLRSNPFADLLNAHHRGRHGEAAGKLYAAVPGLLPSFAVLDTGVNEDQLAQFTGGYRAQVAEMKESFPGLF